MKTKKMKSGDSNEMSLGKNRIYVVDDDESVCRAIRLLLGTFGFEVKTFASASEFLSSVLNNSAGCLILDVHMAEMDGFTLQQRLSANGFRIPIIFISADKTLRFSEEYLIAAGAVGFLQKPFNDQALVDLINAALEKRR
jgi:FixJ family two-component response regulator